MRAAFVALSLLAAPCAVGQVPDAEAIGIPLARRPAAPPTSADGARPRGSGGGLAFANGGFEILAGANPSQWSVDNAPVVLLDGADHYARIGSAHFYGQSIAVPFADRHVTVSARFRCESTGLPAFGVYSPGAEETVFEAVRWTIGPSDGWVRLFGSFALTQPTDSFAVIPGTGAAVSWVDMDDVVAFDEGIAGGSFEGPPDSEVFPAWEFAGGATPVADATLEPGGTTALRLAAGGSASIVAGARDAGQLYFVSAAVRGEGGGATLRVRARDANPLVNAEDHFSSEFAIAAMPGRILAPTGRTPGACRAETVVFEHAAGPPVVVDDASRGFVHAWPPVYYSGPSSLNPALSLVAAWPDEMQSATVAIVDGEDNLVATVPLSVANGTATGTWDGDGNPGGEYDAEFTLVSANGANVVLSRPFEHRVDSGALAEAPPYASSRFERGAWMWLLNNGTDQAELQPIFAEAQQDGFTMAVVIAKASQWAAVRASCEALSMPFLAASTASQSAVRGTPPGISPFSFDGYRTALVEELAPLLGSPMMLGVYAVDEPIMRWEQRNAARAMRSVAAIPEFGVPFTTVTPYNAEAATWDIVRPPVHMTDLYPFSGGETDFVAGLRVLSDHLAEQVAMASARGREYWLVAGAFGSVEGSTPGNAAAVEATFGLCIANGVRGIVPFFYRQINALEGIRTDTLEPLPETDAWIEGNARIAEIEHDAPFFAQHELVAENLESFVVATMRDAADAPLLCAVNIDCRRNADLLVTFGGSDATLTELTTGRTLATTTGSLDIPFAPGDWNLWRIEGAAPADFAEATTAALPATVPLALLADTMLPAGRIHELRFNSSGGVLLASCGGSVYRILNTGQTLSTIPTFGVTSSAWLSTNDALLCSPNIGAYGVRFPSTALADSWLRVPGCAVGAVSAGGGAAWIGNDFLGIRRLQPTGTLTFAESNAGGIPAEAPRGLLGPLPNGDVVVPDIYGDVLRVAASGGGGIATTVLPGPQIVRSASLSPTGTLLVLGRQRRGFTLMALDAGGNVVASQDHAAPNGESVAVVEAMSAELVAVGEFDGDIEFFGIAPDLSLVHRGRWRPDPRPAVQLTAMDSANGLLACGFADGRFVVVNANTLPVEFVDSDLFAIE